MRPPPPSRTAFRPSRIHFPRVNFLCAPNLLRRFSSLPRAVVCRCVFLKWLKMLQHDSRRCCRQFQGAHTPRSKLTLLTSELGASFSGTWVFICRTTTHFVACIGSAVEFYRNGRLFADDKTRDSVLLGPGLENVLLRGREPLSRRSLWKLAAGGWNAPAIKCLVWKHSARCCKNTGKEGISEKLLSPMPAFVFPPFATPWRRGRANYAAGQRTAFGGLFPH